MAPVKIPVYPAPSPVSFSTAFLCLLLFLFGLPFLSPAGAESARPAKDGWVIAVLRFEGENLNIEEKQLCTSIPLYLVDEIERIPRRLLNKEEVMAAAASERKKELNTLRVKLNEALRKRDEAFFEQSEASLLVELEKKISDIKTKIEKLKNEEYGETSEPTEAEVRLTDLNSGGELHDFPDIGLEAWATRNGYDCVVWGRLERLEQMLYVEMKLTYPSTGKTISFYRGVFFANDHMKPVRESVPELRSLIYNRKWADLVPLLNPPVNARYFIDGREVFPDSTGKIRNIEPGEHSITVRAKAYYDSVLSFSLHDRETKTIVLRMKEKKTSSVKIGSYPGGADVFLDSKYAGSTPLLIENLIPPSTLLVSKKDYRERIEVFEGGYPSVDFFLHPECIDIEKIIESSRRRFYHGLAAFLISLPITFVSYGKSIQYAYAYNSAAITGGSSGEEIQRLKSQSTLWYTAYLGGLFINSILFTDTLVRMLGYIRSSQEQ